MMSQQGRIGGFDFMQNLFIFYFILFRELLIIFMDA